MWGGGGGVNHDCKMPNLSNYVSVRSFNHKVGWWDNMENCIEAKKTGLNNCLEAIEDAMDANFHYNQMDIKTICCFPLQIKIWSCKYCAPTNVIKWTAPCECTTNMCLLWIMHDAVPILCLLLIDGKSQTFVSHRITRGAASCFLISWCWGSNELIFYYWHLCPFMYNNVMLGTGAWKTLLGHHNHVLLYFFNEWINCFIRGAGTFFKKGRQISIAIVKGAQS